MQERNRIANVTDSELHELFVAQLKGLLWAETQQVLALAEMARMATEPSLRTALIDHLADTIVHVARLEDIFYGIDVAPRAKVCRAMEGLLAAGEETARQFVDSAALDAALICTAQKIEHYEIATYGTLRAFAEQLELTDVQRGITLTLREESASDRRLSLVAVREANTLAAASE